MSPLKIRAVLGLWALALIVSAALALAGQRWPEPLTPQPGPIAALLIGPPLLMALLLLRRWSLASGPSPALPRDPDRGESGDCAHGER